MKVLTLFRHKRTLYIAGSVLLLAIAFTIGYRSSFRLLHLSIVQVEAASIENYGIIALKGLQIFGLYASNFYIPAIVVQYYVGSLCR